MNVLFRCDGNGEIGAGHLVRCSALAREIARRGGRSGLVCRPVAENLSWALAGVMVLPASPGYTDSRREKDPELDGSDLAALLDYARRWQANWVFVDHYRAGASYLAAIAGKGYQLAVLDDSGGGDLTVADLTMADLTVANLLVNPNLGAERVVYRLKHGAAVCRGPRFAALRPEFGAARARLASCETGRNARRPVEKVFVGFGGSRLAVHGARVAAAIASSNGPSVALAAGMDAAGVAQAMSEADLAITAAGSTVWELCCLGLPAVVWPVAENQRPIAEALEAAGAAVAVDGLQEAVEAARELMKSPERRARLSAAAWKLVDGRGAERVAGEMERLAGRMRGAKVPVFASD